MGVLVSLKKDPRYLRFVLQKLIYKAAGQNFGTSRASCAHSVLPLHLTSRLLHLKQANPGRALDANLAPGTPVASNCSPYVALLPSVCCH